MQLREIVSPNNVFATVAVAETCPVSGALERARAQWVLHGCLVRSVGAQALCLYPVGVVNPVHAVGNTVAVRCR